MFDLILLFLIPVLPTELFLSNANFLLGCHGFQSVGCKFVRFQLLFKIFIPWCHYFCFADGTFHLALLPLVHWARAELLHEEIRSSPNLSWLLWSKWDTVNQFQLRCVDWLLGLVNWFFIWFVDSPLMLHRQLLHSENLERLQPSIISSIRN